MYSIASDKANSGAKRGIQVTASRSRLNFFFLNQLLVVTMWWWTGEDNGIAKAAVLNPSGCCIRTVSATVSVSCGASSALPKRNDILK